MRKYLLYLVGATMLIFSCTAGNNINYLQDAESVALEAAAKNNTNTLQPGDQMIITVSARDMNVVRPFNQNYSSTVTTTQYSNPSSNSQIQPLPSSGPMYTVDSNGTISFPFLGNISTQGLTVEQLRDELRERLTRYVKNPIVTVTLTNYKVTVLGEVNRPGTYVVPDANPTLLSALGLAGDLTIYGVRKNVLVVRNVNGEISRHRIDLTSADFINSPYYYLKQNDVVYVEANAARERTARIDPNTGLYISIASIVVTILALVIRK